jgi:hypothetical protein
LELKDLKPPVGQTHAQAASIFKNEEGRLHGTLVAYQGAGHAEPWLIVTDLPAALAEASWYGLRSWIEQGYKRVKGEGWKLQRTRITSCARLERLWLAVAVATLWVLEVGGEAEAEEQRAQEQRSGSRKQVGDDLPALPDLEPPASTGAPTSGQRRSGRCPEGVGGGRVWSVFGRGWNVLRNALAGGLLVLGSWHPEAWPDPPQVDLPATPTAATLRGVIPEGAGPPGRCSRDVIHTWDSS